MNKLQIRSADGVRWISGIAVPWDEMITYAGGEEVFVRGSLVAADKAIPLRWQHDAIDIPIGVVETTEDRPEGLWVDCRLFDTDAARGAWQSADAGIAGGFSIEFDNEAPGPGITNGIGAQGAVRQATMYGLSLVEDPAYEGARIESIRNANLHNADIGNHRAWLEYFEATDTE